MRRMPKASRDLAGIRDVQNERVTGKAEPGLDDAAVLAEHEPVRRSVLDGPAALESYLRQIRHRRGRLAPETEADRERAVPGMAASVFVQEEGRDGKILREA